MNRYDNEQPDINGDGVQLHVMTPSGLAGWMLIPERGSGSVRVRPIGSPVAIPVPRATWKAVNVGYELDFELSPIPTAIDVIVNEMPAGRERRRGQLVLSGSHGDFVYLRGDRQDADRLIALKVDDV